jgi:hypothetical protein
VEKFFEYIRRFFSSIPGKGFSSAVLLLSSFFAVFSAAPALSTYVGKSRLHGYYVLLIGTVITALIGGVAAGSIYAAVVVLGTIVLGEFIRSNVGFAKTIALSSLIVIGAYAAILASYSLFYSVDPMVVLSSKVKMAIDFMNANYPELIKQTLVDTGMSEKELITSVAVKIPSTVAVVTIVFLFVNLMIVARMDKRMSSFMKLDNLIQFRMPEYLVWPAILLGGLYLYSTTKYNNSITIEAASAMLFKGIMMMYFLHGLMITYVVTSLKVPEGFFRSLLFSLIIIFAYVFVTAVGFFDTWFNFRKYFNKKGEEEL